MHPAFWNVLECQVHVRDCDRYPAAIIRFQIFPLHRTIAESPQSLSQSTHDRDGSRFCPQPEADAPRPLHSMRTRAQLLRIRGAGPSRRSWRRVLRGDTQDQLQPMRRAMDGYQPTRGHPACCGGLAVACRGKIKRLGNKRCQNLAVTLCKVLQCSAKRCFCSCSPQLKKTIEFIRI